MFASTKGLRLLLAAGFSAAVLGAFPAEAGGLFGKRGLIRGSVGNWVDKHVERPITTPVARATVELGSTAAGVTAGAIIGGPKGAAVGGVLGHIVGGSINDSFAGGRPGSTERIIR